MTQEHRSLNSLAYTDRGTGPAVVVLHGLFGSSGNLGHTAKDLAADHRVICVDLPGHGSSDRLDDYAHESMAGAILETLLSLRLHRSSLIGHSLGGKISMQLASRLAGLNKPPLQIDKLVVVDIAPRDYGAHHDEVFQGLNAVPLNAEIDRRQADLLLQQHISDAGIRAFLLKSFRRNPEGQYQWQFDVKELQAQYSKLALSPTLPSRVLCPTLFIKGANSDYILPIDEARIKEAFAHPEFKIIHGTGHWPHAEKPAAFNRQVRRFLTRVNDQ